MHPTKCSKWDPQINHSCSGYQICFLSLIYFSLMFLHLINFCLNKVQRRNQAYNRVSWRPCFSFPVFPWYRKLNQFVLNSLFSTFFVLLLLLSHFSCVRLCATPETAAHQAPLSLGFSRQEHWSGLPFPSPMHESEKWKWKWSRSVVSDS